MSKSASKMIQSIKSWWKAISDPDNSVHFPKPESGPLVPPTPEVARTIFREALTEYVAAGWVIQIENEFDAVLSKKRKFRWFLKLLVFLILLFVFFPLAIFFLVVILVRGLTAKPRNIRLFIDSDGKVQVS